MLIFRRTPLEAGARRRVFRAFWEKLNYVEKYTSGVPYETSSDRINRVGSTRAIVIRLVIICVISNNNNNNNRDAGGHV